MVLTFVLYSNQIRDLRNIGIASEILLSYDNNTGISEITLYKAMCGVIVFSIRNSGNITEAKAPHSNAWNVPI